MTFELDHLKYIRGDGLIFLVSVPRSGSSYLQSLLGSSNKVFTTPNETMFLTRYISKLLRAYDQDCMDNSVNGVAKLIDQEDFLDWVRRMVLDLFHKMGFDYKGGYFLEKSPYNIVYADELYRLFPESKVIHIVRNPLDVVKSHKRINKLSWGGWATGSIEEISEKWSKRIWHTQKFKVLFGPSFLEVKYEDIIHEPYATAGLKKFLGLPDEELTVQGSRLLDQIGFCNDSEYPPISSSEKNIILKICSQGMKRYGYISDHSPEIRTRI